MSRLEPNGDVYAIGLLLLLLALIAAMALGVSPNILSPTGAEVVP